MSFKSFSKRLCVVVDKKGEDIVAPMFVSNHSSALRQYLSLSLSSDSDKPMFVRFPDDYLLVSGDLVFSEGSLSLSNLKVTPFVDFLRSDSKE